MKKLFLALALVLPLVSGANELDREVTNAARLAKDLPQTLVVRVSRADNSVAVMHSNQAIASGTQVADAGFVATTANSGMRSELDADSSTSGWYFYWNNYNYSYPTYYYSGYYYNYQQYYWYANSYYYYYYYNYNYGYNW